MFLSVENESSRRGIFTLQQTLEKCWSSGKLCVNWSTRQEVWSCLHRFHFLWNHWKVTARSSQRKHLRTHNQLRCGSHCGSCMTRGLCQVAGVWVYFDEPGVDPQQRLMVPGPSASTAPAHWQWHDGSARTGPACQLGLSSVGYSQGHLLLLKM